MSHLLQGLQLVIPISTPGPTGKFNLVIYGISAESQRAMWHIHSANDIEAVTSIQSSIHSSILEFSVWDWANSLRTVANLSLQPCQDPMMCLLYWPVDVSYPNILTSPSSLTLPQRPGKFTQYCYSKDKTSLPWVPTLELLRFASIPSFVTAEGVRGCHWLYLSEMASLIWLR